MRFRWIISEPGRIWTEYEVIDLVRNIRMCRCSDERSANEIAHCLNQQHLERQQQLPQQSETT